MEGNQGTEDEDEGIATYGRQRDGLTEDRIALIVVDVARVNINFHQRL